MMRQRICVENPEANARFREITANGQLHGCETIIGQLVRARDNGEHVYARGQSPDSGNVCAGEGGPT